MHAEPQQEHQWLHKLMGEWTCVAECMMGPDQPLSQFTSRESVRSIGGLWVVCEAHGEMPGGGMATTVMTLGYDPMRKRYVGTFLGSMMSNLWVYDGTLDAAGKVLTLDTEGPNVAVEGELAKYQDMIEIISDDQRVLSSQMQNEDGTWHRFMTAHYRRIT